VPHERPLRYDLPAWAPVFHTVALLVFHGVAPFGVSLLSARHGWSAGGPADWNLLGLLPVAGGLTILVWIIMLHYREAPKRGWRMEATPFEPTQYLIVYGPYRYSRNPIFLGHVTIWGGWALYYGSLALVVAAAVMWILLAFVIVPYEERGLVRQLGEPYLRYQRQVGRWFGRGSTTAH